MTKEETLKIMSVLKTAYPRYYVNQTKDELVNAVNLWSMMLEEYEYDVVSGAVKAIIATAKFPPTIAEVIERIGKITSPEELDASDAWLLVKKAIRNSTYNSEREFERLPEAVQMVVGSHEQLRAWACDEESATDTVTASNFRRDYNIKIDRIKEYRAMPQSVKDMLALVSERCKLEDGNGKGKDYKALLGMR